MKIPAMALTFGLAAGVAVLAGAQTAADVNNQVTTMNHSTSNQGQTQVSGKISNDFSSFLGSDATAVVTGLRNGTPISLTSTTVPPGGSPVTTTTVITPPTGQMGFGNVYISLALAKQQLASLDPPIYQPTPEQLQAALNGGTITQTTGSGVTATTTTTTLDGILTMRSQNMGWGQIAQKLGFKLGPVMAGMKSANKNFTATAPTTSTKGSSTASTTTKGNSSSHRSIVSGSGKSHGNAANAVAAGKSSGQGIVSAAGKGNGHAYGHGNGSSIVTGSGSAGGTSGGIVSAGGSGKGVSQGKGHNK
jgi:hypothetical protein